MKYLAICIPNYNRIDKLKRLLEEITHQIAQHFLENNVEICISDDCSTEDPTNVIEDIRKRYPHILFHYTRNEINRGMDYNFLNSVLLSDSEYCWIIGNDDIPTECGIQTVVRKLQEFDSKVDILVTPFDIYTDKDIVRGTVFPLKIEKEQSVCFDTSMEREYRELLFLVQHNSALSGFLSNTVFKRKKWIEYQNKFQDKLNTIFIQMYMNIQTLQDGAIYLYSTEKIIKNYADDVTNESITRICRILLGLDGVVNYFFSGDVKDRMKRVIVDSYISGVVWELPKNNIYKEIIRKIDTVKNSMYKKYFIEPEKRYVFFKNKEVIIFGAGRYGKKVLQEIKNYDANVIGVIDSDPLKQGKTFYDYTIQSPQEVYQSYVSNKPVIVVANHYHLEDMINTLLENEISHIAIIS